MKSLLSILLLMILTIRLSVAQSVGVGTTTPNNSAMLDVQSNTKGMLIPRMTDRATWGHQFSRNRFVGI